MYKLLNRHLPRMSRSARLLKLRRKLPSLSLSYLRRRTRRKSNVKLSLVKHAQLMMRMLVMYPIAKLMLPHRKLLKHQPRKVKKLPLQTARNRLQRKTHLLRRSKLLNRHLPRM
jgi:hypothetical protein